MALDVMSVLISVCVMDGVGVCLVVNDVGLATPGHGLGWLSWWMGLT